MITSILFGAVIHLTREEDGKREQDGSKIM